MLLNIIEVSVDIKLTAKRSAHEISWTLETTCLSHEKYFDNEQYDQTCKLVPGVYNLTCKDSGDDGWSGSFLEIQGTHYCQHFLTGAEATYQVTITGVYNSEILSNNTAGKE